MDKGVWRRCFGGAVSPVYVHCGTLLNIPVVVFISAVYAVRVVPIPPASVSLSYLQMR